MFLRINVYILFSIILNFSLYAQTTVPADDSRIQYIGRTDWSDSTHPSSDWPAFTINARFNGTSIELLLDCAGNYFAVMIDDERQAILEPHSGEQQYSIDGLADSDHTISIGKRSEGYNGVARFGGFILPSGTTLLDAPPEPQYLIEIIGDSYSVGYGADAD